MRNATLVFGIHWRDVVSGVAVLALACFSAFSADDAPAPEPGERALNAKESDAALSGIAEAFKAHPTVRAKIRSEIEDLAGKRVEDGELLLDRSEGSPARVLRTFAKPKQKAWLLNGATISEYVASKKTVFVKDLSAAPKTLKHIQAAMTGDVHALEEIFTIRVFSKPGALRLVLDKKPKVSHYIHRRIEARFTEGGMFFDQIRYIPDEGDEVTETFLELKDAGKLSDADFALQGTDGSERKVEKIAE